MIDRYSDSTLVISDSVRDSAQSILMKAAVKVNSGSTSGKTLNDKVKQGIMKETERKGSHTIADDTYGFKGRKMKMQSLRDNSEVTL